MKLLCVWEWEITWLNCKDGVTFLGIIRIIHLLCFYYPVLTHLRERTKVVVVISG